MAKVELKDNELQKFLDYVNWFIEHFIFFRWSCLGYGAYPKNNLRIFSALFSTIVILAISYCILMLLAPSDINLSLQGIVYKSSASGGSVDSEITLLFFAILGAFFWNEKAKYVSQWSYLANLYNDILKVDKEKREGLKLAFSQDLVEMGFYGHSSFYAVFKEALVDADLYQKCIDNDVSDDTEIKEFIADEEKRKISSTELNKKYRKKEALLLLENYQEYVL